jgi:hypothetical protein
MEKGFYLILLALIIFLFSIQTVSALTATQAWNVTFDANSTSTGWYCNDIDSLDNSIQAGDIDPGDDGLMAKYDRDGNLVWNFTTPYYYFRGVVVDSNDDIYASGKSNDSDPGFVKYNSTGSQLWNISFHNGTSGQFNNVAVDGNDDVIVIGWDTTSGYDYSWIVKYNSTGTQLWNQSWPDDKETVGFAIAVDSNDNIFAEFSYGDILVDRLSILAKYNSSGDHLWNWTYAGALFGSSPLTSLVVDSGDNVITAIFDIDGGFNSVAQIFKFNNSGGQLWNTTFADEASGSVTPSEMAVDSEDNIVVPMGVNNGVPVKIVKYDPDGYQMWNVSFRSLIQDDFQGIEVESNNSIIISGDGKYNSTHFNNIVAQYDDGTPKWSNFYKVGKTTYLYNESDLDSVSDLKIGNAYSLIEWNQAVNVSYADINTYFSIGNGYISLNSAYLHSSFNSSANVSINISDCSDWVIYQSNTHVTSLAQLKIIGSIAGTKTSGCVTGYCSNPTCENNQLNYTVTSFSSTGGEYMAGVAVPEFSTYALFLAIALVMGGFMLIRQRTIKYKL